MAAYPIEIVQLGQQTYNDIIIEVLDKLNELQNDFQFSPPIERNRLWGLPLEFESYTTRQIWDNLKEYREERKGFHPFIVGVINGSLSSDSLSNIFGERNVEANLAVFTTNDWDVHFAPPPLKVYLMYYFIRYTISFVCPELKTHDDKPECFLHKKMDKLRIKDSMESGKLCDSCRAILNRKVDEHISQSLSQLISRLRDETLNGPLGATKPKVFIGSSSNGLPIAEALQNGLRDFATCTIWNEGSFVLSLGNLENLERTTQEYKYAILVLTPDDVIIKQHAKRNSPRGNVLFELGLFMGALGRNHTFMLSCESDTLDMPSDLEGVVRADFKKEEGVSLLESLAPACSKIMSAIRL